MLCSSSKKVAVCFTIISNLAVTTHVSVNNVSTTVGMKASKKELICVLPFLGKKSIDFFQEMEGHIESNLGFCKLKIIFQSPCKLILLFHYKDSLHKRIRPDIVYYGKTYRHFFTKAAEHMGISNLIGKRLNVSNNQQYQTIYLNVTVR